MVDIQNAGFRYGETEDNGICDVTLHIRKGECVLLCGESGCGKTTLTRLANGLVPHFYEGTFSGTVTVDGSDTAATGPDRLAHHVGSVFQNPRSQFFNLDTTSEIAFGCENTGISPAEIRTRVDDAAKALGVAHLLDRDIFALSGGEKQRIAMASAYALGPDLFVLDEPSANLDAAACRELGRLLKRLKGMGKTILVAEHRLYYLMDVIDRVVYLQNGCVVGNHTANEFVQRPAEWRAEHGLRAISHTGLMPSAPPVAVDGTARLDVSGLSASYKRGQPVLRNVSFSAAPGEVIGILGRNGQGKSTLARVLCGLHKEAGGTVELDGKKLPAPKRTEQFYLVMQETNHQLFTDSVDKELRLAKSRREQPDDAQVNAVLEELALTPYRERHPMSLSGGQKQRCAIGVALARAAPVLIFDEPTSGLDYRNMRRVCGIIQRLRQQGRILFVITHDYELLLAAATRALVLENGEIANDTPLRPDTLSAIQPLFA